MLQITRGVHTGRELLAQRCSKLVDSVIRVDHAGELGANQIYRGQMAILGKRLK